MRTFKFIAAAVVAATVSVSAFAEPASAIPANSAATAVLVQAAMQSQYKLTEDQAYGMVGTFRLADGRKMVLTNVQNRLFAEFDGRREELLPVAQNRFVSRVTGANLTFDQVPYSMSVVLDQLKK